MADPKKTTTKKTARSKSLAPKPKTPRSKTPKTGAASSKAMDSKTANSKVAKSQANAKETTNKKVVAETSAKPAATKTLAKQTKQDARKKEVVQTNKEASNKNSSNSVAWLAFLCALGALLLSGYNAYERKLSLPTASTKILLSEVSIIGSNVAEFGDIIIGIQDTVTEVQKNVSAITSDQVQFVTTESLITVVSQQVSDALRGTNVASSSPAVNVKDILTNDDEVITPEKVINESLVSDGSAVIQGRAATDSVQSSLENSDDSEGWSWQRAKADFLKMFNFISIRKIDEK